MLGLKLKVSEREVGELGISIPTSVAIESLLAEEKIPETEIWINARTLFRNLHGSVDKDFRESLNAEDVVPTLINEMEFISKNVKGLKAHFYFPDYSDIAMRLPNAIARPVNTDKQKIYLVLEDTTMKALLKAEVGVKPFRTQIKSETSRAKVLLITHSPIDLLFNDFAEVRLLESHTGKFKTKSEWNTKLTNGNLLTNLPFNLFTIQIFGDNNGLLKAMPIALRTVVMEMAEKDHWTPVSSRDRIAASIGKLKDHFARALLMKILRS